MWLAENSNVAELFSYLLGTIVAAVPNPIGGGGKKLLSVAGRQADIREQGGRVLVREQMAGFFPPALFRG